jgi:mycothiol S-conjugate amidase
MPDQRCLLSVHAHPDDESSKGPATIARYHGEGVHTVLVCCTGGEEGDILNPAMDKPEVRENLAEVRRQELATATSIIGYDEVVMLGYRDSGMPDSEANKNPDCFAMAPLDEAVGRLVAIIRRVRPQVIITYPEEQNQYPHPDHIRVHEISAVAFDAAGDPDAFPEAGAPHEPQKLYYSVLSVARMRALHEKFLELGLESPLGERWLSRLDSEPNFTTSVSTEGYDDVRGAALRAHATQVDPSSRMWFGLPPEVQRGLHPFDEYLLARSRVPSVDGIEDDLFAGLTADVFS